MKVEEHFENQYLTRTEELRVLAVARETNTLAYTLVLILLKTGARVSEISNLLICDMSLEENPTILIRNSKGKKSRYIPISSDVVESLNEWLKERGKSQKFTTGEVITFYLTT
ncbi:tyrosine-type recombinase/integrase [Piscibacillus salipiscarius]|uniref:tyrosine-type recombinase/integrase n=1 Tax=Piscibacillus salipiscarius TaxID=299480 RepID=UPI0034E20D6A